MQILKVRFFPVIEITFLEISESKLLEITFFLSFVK